MKFFRLAALGAALLYLSDATRRARLRERVLGLISGARETVAAETASGDAHVSDDLDQRVRAVQGVDSDETPSTTLGTEAPTTTA